MARPRFITEDSDLFNERKQIKKETKEYLKKHKINWSAIKNYNILKKLPSFKCAKK